MIKYMNEIRWCHKKGMKSGTIRLTNGIEVYIIEVRKQFLIKPKHPLLKQRAFESTISTDRYLSSIGEMKAIGEYQDE